MRLWRLLKARLRRTSLGRRLTRTGPALAWIALAAVLLTSTIWASVGGWPHAPIAGLVLGAIATVVAVLTHHVAHRLAAMRSGLEVTFAVWPGGILIGLLGISMQVPAGPFPGERFPDTDRRTRADRDRVWWVTLVGPVASIAAAAVAYLVYLWIPMPFLRLLVVTHLAVAGFSLIAMPPLDGSRLATYRPWVPALIGVGLATGGALLATGLV